MIHIDFSKEAIDALDYERYHHPHPKVQKKMEVLYLKSQDVKHKEIIRLCRISKKTLTNYLHQYKLEGIEGLKKLNYRGQPSELWEHVSSIEEYFRKHPPANAGEAQAAIEKLTGIKRSPTQIREFLKKNRLKMSENRSYSRKKFNRRKA